MGATGDLMIPQNRLSTTPVRSGLRLENPQPSLTRALHRGGIAIGDPSQGFDVQTWTAETNGLVVTLAAGAGAATPLFTGTGITELSLAFDQNMRPFVAFVEGGIARFRWFDPTANDFVVTTLPAGAVSPRCTLDDYRPMQLARSDIIIAYLVGRTLFFRAQRDRYLVEYLLQTGMFNRLQSVSMGLNNRLHFVLGEALA
jgi:hypothetical protein